MSFIQWCCERGAKSHGKRTKKKPWRKRQSRSWRFSFHKYFTTFFLFIPLFQLLYFIIFFLYFFYPRHLLTPAPTTHTHDPRHIATLFKIWLAARRLIAILSLARPPQDPKSSFRSLLKQLFCCETRAIGQFVANPSPVIFAGVLASKVLKIKIRIQCQRDEASQSLVKHDIMISLHSFLKTCSACLLILTAVGRFI